MQTLGNQAFLQLLHSVGRSVPQKKGPHVRNTNEIRGFEHVSCGTALIFPDDPHPACDQLLPLLRAKDFEEEREKYIVGLERRAALVSLRLPWAIICRVYSPWRQGCGCSFHRRKNVSANDPRSVRTTAPVFTLWR